MQRSSGDVLLHCIAHRNLVHGGELRRLDGSIPVLLAQPFATGLRIDGGCLVKGHGPDILLQAPKLTRPEGLNLTVCIPLRIQAVKFCAVPGEIGQIESASGRVFDHRAILVLAIHRERKSSCKCGWVKPQYCSIAIVQVVHPNGPDIPLVIKKIEALCLHFLTSDDISFFIGYIHGNLLLSGGGNCRELSGSRSQM